MKKNVLTVILIVLYLIAVVIRAPYVHETVMKSAPLDNVPTLYAEKTVDGTLFPDCEGYNCLKCKYKCLACWNIFSPTYPGAGWCISHSGWCLLAPQCK